MDLSSGEDFTSMPPEELAAHIGELEASPELDRIAHSGMNGLTRPAQVSNYSTDINECGVLFLELGRRVNTYTVERPGHGQVREWRVTYIHQNRTINATGNSLQLAITRAVAFLAVRWV